MNWRTYKIWLRYRAVAVLCLAIAFLPVPPYDKVCAASKTENSADSDLNKVSIVHCAKNVPPGSKVTREALVVRRIDAAQVPSNAIGYPLIAESRIAKHGLHKGQIVTLDDVDLASQLAKTGQENLKTVFCVKDIPPGAKISSGALATGYVAPRVRPKDAIKNECIAVDRISRRGYSRGQIITLQSLDLMPAAGLDAKAESKKSRANNSADKVQIVYCSSVVPPGAKVTRRVLMTREIEAAKLPANAVEETLIAENRTTKFGLAKGQILNFVDFGLAPLTPAKPGEQSVCTVFCIKDLAPGALLSLDSLAVGYVAANKRPKDGVEDIRIAIDRFTRNGLKPGQIITLESIGLAP